MNFFEATLLGIVEGITEFLPISSTGHLVLTSHLLALEQTDFLKSFEIAIQLGAILAVVMLYWRFLFLNWEGLKKIIAAFIPTAVIGFALYGVIKNYLLGSNTITLWALFIGGILLIVFEFLHKEKEDALEDISKLSYKNALTIGLFQSLAVIPGVSRAGATILGGLLLGMKRKAIIEFSFLLAIPTMLGATVLDLGSSFNKISGNDWIMLTVGFVVSFLVALAAVKFLLSYIKNHTFIPFGVYRIALALLFWLVVL